MTDVEAELRQQLARRDEEIKNLREIIQHIRKSLDEEVDGLEFGRVLTRTERMTLAILIRRKRVTRDQIHSVLYSDDPDGGPGPKVIDVFMSHIRRKLRPLGIVIETIYGVGFQLSDASRDLIDPLPEQPVKPLRRNADVCAGQISMFEGV